MFKYISPDVITVSVSDNDNKIVEGEMYNVGNKQSLNVEKTRKQTGKPRVINPEDFDSVDDLFAEVRYWWTKRYRKGEDSWNSYENKLRDMMNHEIYPIDPFNLNPDQVVAHLDFVEDQVQTSQTDESDKAGIYRVINRWKAVKALMRSYGMIEEVNNWNYTPPSDPKPKPKKIPSLGMVHKLIHHKYSSDRYETKLYQYLALFSFMIGFRTASEMSILKVEDWDEDTKELTFYQPKTESWRTVVLPDRMIHSKNTKNITSWIDSWRPKVETSESKDYMFLQINGKPFTKAYLTKKLRENFRPIWNQYYPYSSRHWYATASLIKTRAEYGTYDMTAVCDDMHHSSESVTKGYTRTANQWFKKAPFDWFKALLKYTKNCTVKELKTSTLPKNGGTGNFSPRDWYESAGVKTCFLLLELPVLEQKTGVLVVFSTFLSNSFFSFFYVFFIVGIEVLTLPNYWIFFPSVPHLPCSFMEAEGSKSFVAFPYYISPAFSPSASLSAIPSMGIGGLTGCSELSLILPSIPFIMMIGASKEPSLKSSSIAPIISTKPMFGIQSGSSPELSFRGRDTNFFLKFFHHLSLFKGSPISSSILALEMGCSTIFLFLVHSLPISHLVVIMFGIQSGSSPGLSIDGRGLSNIFFDIFASLYSPSFIMGAGSSAASCSGSWVCPFSLLANSSSSLSFFDGVVSPCIVCCSEATPSCTPLFHDPLFFCSLSSLSSSQLGGLTGFDGAVVHG